MSFRTSMIKSYYSRLDNLHYQIANLQRAKSFRNWEMQDNMAWNAGYWFAKDLLRLQSIRKSIVFKNRLPR